MYVVSYVQVSTLSSRGLVTGSVTGDMTSDMAAKIKKGECQIVFFSPEVLLQQSRWRSLLQSKDYRSRLRTFVIDEAHTVVKWLVFPIAHTVLKIRFRNAGQSL